MNSPPLLERGTSFFVDFREAPEGRYVYSSRSHGEPAYGSVTVGRESTERECPVVEVWRPAEKHGASADSAGG